VNSLGTFLEEGLQVKKKSWKRAARKKKKIIPGGDALGEKASGNRGEKNDQMKKEEPRKKW